MTSTMPISPVKSTVNDDNDIGGHGDTGDDSNDPGGN